MADLGADSPAFVPHVLLSPLGLLQGDHCRIGQSVFLFLDLDAQIPDPGQCMLRDGDGARSWIGLHPDKSLYLGARRTGVWFLLLCDLGPVPGPLRAPLLALGAEGRYPLGQLGGPPWFSELVRWGFPGILC